MCKMKIPKQLESLPAKQMAGNKKLRILFVAMTHSIHTIRWINQFADQGWDIHLFPSDNSDVNPNLKDVTVHDTPYIGKGPFIISHKMNANIRFAGTRHWLLPRGVDLANRIWRWSRKLARKQPAEDRTDRLVNLIRSLQPQIVHSLETQHAGYLVLDARLRMGTDFPRWVHTPWGSDIFLFGRLDEHKEKIRSVLAACNYYGPKSERDVTLARQFNFRGEMLPILPGNGGIDFETVRRFCQPGLSSGRRLILIKGYQHWAGRALFGLQAIRLAAPFLQSYRVAVYLANDAVKVAAELITHDTGLPIDIIPNVSHDDMLKLQGQARISMGISISDGVPNSMLEAMAMGAFPIESDASCAGEWLVDGENGFIVPPENPDIIAAAIRKAVEDDNLVDHAAEINAKIIMKRLNPGIIKNVAVAMYHTIAEHK